MNLLKCNHCGRPFYDDVKVCPFCGHATNLSANNRVTKAISNPASHRLMEDFFSGNLHQPRLEPEKTKVQQQPCPEPEQTTEQQQPCPEPEKTKVQQQPCPEPEQITEQQQPSDAVLERADSIASIKADNSANTAESSDKEPDEIETTLPRKKRRGWIWIVILIIILALAAAAYFNWDFVYEKITSIIG